MMQGNKFLIWHYFAQLNVTLHAHTDMCVNCFFHISRHVLVISSHGNLIYTWRFDRCFLHSTSRHCCCLKHRRAYIDNELLCMYYCILGIHTTLHMSYYVTMLLNNLYRAKHRGVLTHAGTYMQKTYDHLCKLHTVVRCIKSWNIRRQCRQKYAHPHTQPRHLNQRSDRWMHLSHDYAPSNRI